MRSEANMRITGVQTLLFVALVALSFSSSNAKTLQRRQAEDLTLPEPDKTDYFETLVTDLGELQKIPFVGNLMTPYVMIAQKLITDIDNVTEGNLRAVVNSVMPCNLSATIVTCEGTLDKEAARNLAKTLLNVVPLNILPPSIASILQLLSDMI